MEHVHWLFDRARSMLGARARGPPRPPALITMVGAPPAAWCQQGGCGAGPGCPALQPCLLVRAVGCAAQPCSAPPAGSLRLPACRVERGRGLFHPQHSRAPLHSACPAARRRHAARWRAGGACSTCARCLRPAWSAGTCCAWRPASLGATTLRPRWACGASRARVSLAASVLCLAEGWPLNADSACRHGCATAGWALPPGRFVHSPPLLGPDDTLFARRMMALTTRAYGLQPIDQVCIWWERWWRHGPGRWPGRCGARAPAASIPHPALPTRPRAGTLGPQRPRFPLVSTVTTPALAPQVWIDYKDLHGLTAEALEGRRAGMAGKQIIHPSQIAPVQVRCAGPGWAELAGWAEVLALPPGTPAAHASPPAGRVRARPARGGGGAPAGAGLRGAPARGAGRLHLQARAGPAGQRGEGVLDQGRCCQRAHGRRQRAPRALRPPPAGPTSSPTRFPVPRPRDKMIDQPTYLQARNLLGFAAQVGRGERAPE